jgi:hypothetical protein
VFLTTFAVLSSCAKRERIAVAEVSGFGRLAEDTDLYPIYDRAYYEQTLPDDQLCRIRYTEDFEYSVFSGNRYVSERSSPTYLYASQYSDEFEARGTCKKTAEKCGVAELRRGYTLTIQGDRLNLRAEPDRLELLKHLQFLYRHGTCQRPEAL